jgi:DNA-binding GntR family transcriptional regulator
MVLDLTSFDRPKNLNVNAYQALRAAIATIDIYDDRAVLRLDERKLSEQLGISRTPLRDALARLDQDGIVKIVARRGVLIIRKTKVEIIETIAVWATLEGLAVRLAGLHASERQIAQLGRLLSEPDNARQVEFVPAFHEAIFRLAGNRLLRDLADGLLVHLRALWICAGTQAPCGFRTQRANYRPAEIDPERSSAPGRGRGWAPGSNSRAERVRIYGRPGGPVLQRRRTG